jgi:DNA invertase Pin-like site-specific DNA recombinase
MLIGFARSERSKGGERNERELLRELGCTRIFESKLDPCLTDEVIGYLRKGDVLAVTELARIADSLEDLVQVVERLTKDGIAIRAERDGIVPGTEIGDSFAANCCILADFHNKANRQQHLETRGRGRPLALDAETRARVDGLLRDGSADVVEIARSLKVSPTTIYRHVRRQRHGKPARAAPLSAAGPARS